ncbi:MAG: flagellin FliC [Burkholderiales bacterium]|nr:flagellin FliC [Burkholderiales bacterium]
MMQSINTNVSALNASRNLGSSQSALNTAVQRLSSGLRVNSAKDDSAGLAIAERMNAQVRGMNVAIRNANDGISLAQTAEGALSKIADMFQRMRELAVQSANATNSSGDRTNLNAEYQQMSAEITRVIANTSFNGAAIIGSGAGAQAFQVGAGTAAHNQITVTTTNLGAAGAVLTATTAATSQVDTAANAATAITNVDAAIDAVSAQRAIYGAAQNRFESTISVLQVASENEAAARGRIVDADYAKETAALSRAQILQQAGTAMLAQANQLPQNVLTLLR